MSPNSPAQLLFQGQIPAHFEDEHATGIGTAL
jgi:hypothetical protein